MDKWATFAASYLEVLGGPLDGEHRRWDGRSVMLVEPARRRVATGLGTRTVIDWARPEHHYVLSKDACDAPCWRYHGQAHA